MIHRFLVPLISALTLCLLPSCTKKTSASETTAPPLPQQRREWKSLLKWPDECDQGVKHITQVSTEFVGIETYQLASGETLVTVVCQTGAYNQGERVYIRQNNSAEFTPVEFIQFAPASQAPTLSDSVKNKEPAATPDSIPLQEPYYQFQSPMLWGNLIVDQDAQLQRVDNFYRGGGGCGLSTTYQIENGQVQVKQLRLQQTCSQETLEVAKWPVISEAQYNNWITGSEVER